MVDNLGGGRGRMPTPEHLQRMTRLVDSLPNGSEQLSHFQTP
jgi:hypothetical protein